MDYISTVLGLFGIVSSTYLSFQLSSFSPAQESPSHMTLVQIPGSQIDLQKLESSVLGIDSFLIEKNPKSKTIHTELTTASGTIVDIDNNEIAPKKIYIQENFPLTSPIVKAWNKSKNIFLWHQDHQRYHGFIVQDMKSAEMSENLQICTDPDLMKTCVKQAEEDLINKYQMQPIPLPENFVFNKNLNMEILLSMFLEKGRYQVSLYDMESNTQQVIDLPNFTSSCQNCTNKNFIYQGVYKQDNIPGIFLFYTYIDQKIPSIYFIGKKILDKSLSELFNNIGMKYYEEKNWEKAGKYFQKAIDTDRAYAQAYFNQACVFALDHNKKDSLISLNKAISIEEKYKLKARKDPDFDRIREDEAFLEVVK